MITQAVHYSPMPSYPPSSYSQTVEDKPWNYHPNNSLSVNNDIKPVLNFRRLNSTENVREFSREYNELIEQAPWVIKFLQSASTLNDVKSLLPFYMEINKLIADKKFNICNSFIEQVIIKDLSDTLLVGLLRLTSSHKNDLPYWTRLLTDAKEELSYRKYDSDSILKGLL